MLGMPVDVIDMSGVVRRIEAAAAGVAPFLLATPNLNFLVNSLSDAEFRESLLLSDLCPVDGAPIVWIARLLGVPLRERVAGSDIFEELKARNSSKRALTVFFFGGAPGAAEAASKELSGRLGCRLSCVGSMFPGYGSVEDLSSAEIIATINASKADFLIVALGAQKGQAWLLRNHHRLRIPVRAHLGAVINFQAGTVKRAPLTLRKFGLEWLWRIKEEPHLWKRYWKDGCLLLRLLLTRVLPVTMSELWPGRHGNRNWQELRINWSRNDECVTLSLSGAATARYVEKAVVHFRDALESSKKLIIVDLTATRTIDARFFGLLLMLRKQLMGRGASMKFVGVSPEIRRVFSLNEVGYLLSAERGA